mgnify:FL=1
MRIQAITAKTGSAVDGTLKEGKGIVEVYENLAEVRANITQAHVDLLNSILVIRAQDEVRKGLQDVPLTTLANRKLKELKRSNPKEYAKKMKELAQLMGLGSQDDDGFVIER